MNLERFREMLVESVGVGLAILRPDTLQIVFRNRLFGEWFADADLESAAIGDVIPGLDLERLRERAEAGRTYTASTEVKAKRRTIALSVQATPQSGEEDALLVLECQNVSKLRELEYMVESYSAMLEKQNRSLQREKERAEKLLLNIMPKKVYEEIRSFGVAAPQRFDSASVLMLDFVGFTEMTVAQEPAELVSELNDIFTSFDRIAEQFGCERIKTIGDAYMAVCGVPEAVADHPQNIAKLALLCLRYVEKRNQTRTNQWRCRIGINTGPVIGSIVGVQRYVYDIFGPGVNLAARMESISGPMEITLCDDMYRLLRADRFLFEERGEEEVKGFGSKRLYRLVGEKGGERSEAIPSPLPGVA